MRQTVLPITLLAALVVASPASAKHGDDDDGGGGDRNRQEVRVAGSCGSGATSKLKLKTDDGGIEAEFEIDRNIAGQRWKVTLVRDGSVVARGNPKTNTRSGSFSFERQISNLSGADTITARGTGPDGLTCTATATLPE